MTASSLEGRIAVVTGAASGIGRAIAQRFAIEGAMVACVDLNRGELHATVDGIRRSGGKAEGFAADVRSENAIAELAAEARRRLGPIDTVVANAGIHTPGAALETSLVSWNQVLDVNLTGAWLTSRLALDEMIERRYGVIIFTSSIAALVGVPAAAAYSATKGAVLALTRQMACDYAPYGVRVNAICPGGVETPLVARAREALSASAGRTETEGRRHMNSLYPLGRTGTAEEIAGLARYLASDEAAWITGGAFVIDGGRTALSPAATGRVSRTGAAR